MYHQMVRRKVEATFGHLNRHDFEPVVAGFAPAIQHSFAGEHALGGTRHSQASARKWYERLFRLFPEARFTVKDMVIAGLPGDTRIAIQFTVENGAYRNDVAQFIRLRWGRITEIALYEDTGKLIQWLMGLQQRGISEAGAAPIVD